ncbi:MAG TPA: ATP-binding cassette domain-containing protein, partial [Acidiphilium sp.]
MTASAAIAARSVSKSFGGVKALTGASFTVEAGSVHALVGENGAGKSTLIKVLGGRIAPDAGEIVIAPGLGVGTVFQELTLLPYMRVADN